MGISKRYKSPINYTGNKYRILDQFAPFFPEGINKAMDLFTGGATVAINMEANEIIAIDSNKRVIMLLNFLREQNFEAFETAIYRVIKEYRLSDSFNNGYDSYRSFVVGNNGLKHYNSEGYYKLRASYNALTDKDSELANLYLYILMVYGFNNDIRFNSNGEFNLPVGKTDMNKNNWQKVRDFIKVCEEKNISFFAKDFKEISISDLSDIDFIYADPPYLIGNAVYNENSGWSKTDEVKLLAFLDMVNGLGIKFALSNVIENGNSDLKNNVLYDWLKRNETYRIHEIDYHYRSSSYNKKNRDSGEQEVLITNY